ncbi:hypothetical protein TELCIR_25972, partial [Teladorsagia circumcincta]
SMIQMRSDAAAVSAGGKLYVSGGFNGTEVLNRFSFRSLYGLVQSSHTDRAWGIQWARSGKYSVHVDNWSPVMDRRTTDEVKQ